MKKIEEFDYINNLFLIYGNLLTEKQKEIVEQYYVYNLSLSEISENINISRSAVSDSLLHAKDNLLKYEEELKIYEKQGNLVKARAQWRKALKIQVNHPGALQKMANY